MTPSHEKGRPRASRQAIRRAHRKVTSMNIATTTAGCKVSGLKNRPKRLATRHDVALCGPILGLSEAERRSTPKAEACKALSLLSAQPEAIKGPSNCLSISGSLPVAAWRFEPATEGRNYAV